MVTSNNGRHSGQKKPFKLEDIWRIRPRIEIEGNIRDHPKTQQSLSQWIYTSHLKPDDYLMCTTRWISSLLELLRISYWFVNCRAIRNPRQFISRP